MGCMSSNSLFTIRTLSAVAQNLLKKYMLKYKIKMTI